MDTLNMTVSESVTFSENMSTTADVNGDIFDGVSSNSSVIHSVTYSYIVDVIHVIGFIVALVGVVSGCFVIDIVRKLNDDAVRSRFSLLCVLICDVILAVSNLTNVVYILTLIDRQRFSYLRSPFVYAMILSTVFSIPLALSFMCLAIDQVIAVFKPIYFRTSEGTRRKIIYGCVIFIPIPAVGALLISTTWDIIKGSAYNIDALALMRASQGLVQYIIDFNLSLAVSTPVVYAVVLWKISRQRGVHSENPVEHIQNRRLVVSFFLLSASYFLFWMPIIGYFIVCYYKGNTCWDEESTKASLAIHIFFTMNYVVDPITCVVRIEPIKQRVLKMFRAC